MELEYRVTWPRKGRPPERRYKVYKTLGYAHEKISKLLEYGFQPKEIELWVRSVEVGEWRQAKGDLT